MAETSAGLRSVVFALGGDNLDDAGRVFAGPFRNVVLSGAIRAEILETDPFAAVVTECDGVTGDTLAIGELPAVVVGFSGWTPLGIVDPWENLAGLFGTHAEDHHSQV